MHIQVLQGINLQSDTTRIIVEFEKKPNVNLVRTISDFHPVFCTSYEIVEKTLTVSSKLPHLWKEISKILDSESKKIINEGDALEAIKKLIKKQVLSMSTIPVLYEAMKMDEEVTQFMVDEGILEHFGESKYNRQYSIGCGRRSELVLSSSTSKDSKDAKQIQEDKFLTNTLISRLNFPIAKWEVIYSKEHIKEIFSSYRTPVVIKPTSLTGGHGVFTGIRTLEDALDAYQKALETVEKVTDDERRRRIIIQEQVVGEDYRLLVVNGKLMIATKRIPAFVEGNGKDTIEELIEKTNKDIRRDIQSPTHTLKPILIDEPMLELLKEKELSLNYIPAIGERIVVRKVASMSQGGITEDYTDKVCTHIKFLAEALARTLRAYVLGVDVICKDLSSPLTIENGSIIEVNTMPEAYLNLFPVLGKERSYVAKDIVLGLLEDKAPVRKIVVIGGDKNNLYQILDPILDNKDEIVGIYSNETLLINNEEINSNVTNWKAVEALKVNALLSTIVLHYQSMEEVEEVGTGFDYLDSLYISKDHTQAIAHFEKLVPNKIKNLSIF